MAKISITKVLLFSLVITSSTILVVINSSMKTSLQNPDFGINEAWINSRQDFEEEVINDTEEEIINTTVELEDSPPEEKFLDGIFLQ